MVLAIKNSSEETGSCSGSVRCTTGWSKTLLHRDVRELHRLWVVRLLGIDIVKSYNDPHPHFRGVIAEIGPPFKRFPSISRRRKRGITKTISIRCTTWPCWDYDPLEGAAAAGDVRGFAGAGFRILAGLGYSCIS